MTSGIIVLLWAAVGLYALSSVVFVISTVFNAKRLSPVALLIAAAGILPQIAALIWRWILIGHGPYIGFFEIITTLVLTAVIALLLLSLYRRALMLVGVVVMPLSFLILGGTMLTPKSALPIPPSMASFWLIVHVVFAQLSFTAFFVAFALGIFYLIRDWRDRKQKAAPVENEHTDSSTSSLSLWAKLPKQSALDNLIFRLAAVGFILWTIMIIAGAIWADKSWGRYWSWDPIETWSLVAWIVYALFMHLRLTMHWKGKKSVVYVVVAMLVVAFAFVGVPFVYNSIHAAYLSFGK